MILGLKHAFLVLGTLRWVGGFGVYFVVYIVLLDRTGAAALRRWRMIC